MVIGAIGGPAPLAPRAGGRLPRRVVASSRSSFAAFGTALSSASCRLRFLLSSSGARAGSPQGLLGRTHAADGIAPLTAIATLIRSGPTPPLRVSSSTRRRHER
jgi:hypothetical protein